jgi:hypothetical protein
MSLLRLNENIDISFREYLIAALERHEPGVTFDACAHDFTGDDLLRQSTSTNAEKLSISKTTRFTRNTSDPPVSSISFAMPTGSITSGQRH